VSADILVSSIKLAEAMIPIKEVVKPPLEKEDPVASTHFTTASITEDPE
jgi:hypothetical protein